MQLSELIAFKVGNKFKFRDETATIIWREYEQKHLGKNEEGRDLFKLDFNIYFEYGILNKPVNLTSCYPKPAILKLDSIFDIL
jgi:hypothetical protein